MSFLAISYRFVIFLRLFAVTLCGIAVVLSLFVVILPVFVVILCLFLVISSGSVRVNLSDILQVKARGCP